jgi:DNA repair protein RadC
MRQDLLYASGRRAVEAQPRVRERLAREGPSALSDAELLATLLGTGMRGTNVHELAKEVVGLLDSS